MSELNPTPPRKQWGAPGEDRRRPSSVETEYKGEERRRNLEKDPMLQPPASGTENSSLPEG